MILIPRIEQKLELDKFEYYKLLIWLKENKAVSLHPERIICSTYFDTIDFLNSFNGTKTFFLKSSINTIFKRLRNSKIKRPLISHLKTELEIKEFIGKHLLERNYFYEKSEKK